MTSAVKMNNKIVYVAQQQTPAMTCDAQQPSPAATSDYLRRTDAIICNEHMRSPPTTW